MKVYVLDACALIAFINDEAGADVVESLLSGDDTVVISIINLYEVYYDMMRNSGKEKADSIFSEIERMPIQIFKKISKDTIEKAAYFKTSYSISLADSIALGLTKHLGGIIVTADHHEFDIIEQEESLGFHWIR